MLIYTILGGFLAESASVFMQAIVMIIALAVAVFIDIAGRQLFPTAHLTASDAVEE